MLSYALLFHALPPHWCGPILAGILVASFMPAKIRDKLSEFARLFDGSKQ